MPVIVRITVLFLVMFYGYSIGSEDVCEKGLIEINLSCNSTINYPLLPIEVCIEIVNNSNTMDYYGNLYNITESLVIMNSKSQIIHCEVSSTVLTSDSLLPNESIKVCPNILFHYPIKKPDVYSCYLSLYNQKKSNTIYITVQYPKGDDSLAWLLFRKAKKSAFKSGDIAQNRIDSYNHFLEIVDKYPESVYAPYALRDAFFRSLIMDRQTVQDKSKEYIEAGFTGQLLDICLESIVATSVMLDDRTAGEAYLQSIIDQNPNSAKADRAKYWLDDLRKRPERK